MQFSRLNALRVTMLISWATIILAVVLLIGPVNLLDAYKNLDPREIRDFVLSFGTLAVLAFILVSLIRPVFFLPVTPFTLAAGFLFGIWGGLACSLAGTLLSAILTFAVARFLFHDYAKNNLLGRHQIVDMLMTGRSWKSVVIARLVPAIPFDAVGYVAGTSHIAFKEYFLGTLLGELPGAIVLVVLGASLMDAGSALFYGSLVLAIMLFAVPEIARRILRRAG